MGKLVALPGSGDLSADTILEMAKGRLSECCIIGKDEDGDLAIWGTTSRLDKLMWMIVSAEHWLIHDAARSDT